MSPETLSGHSEACKATQLAFNFDLSGSPEVRGSRQRCHGIKRKNWKGFIPTTTTHLTPKQGEDHTGLSLGCYPHTAPGWDVCIITQASAFMRSFTARCKHLSERHQGNPDSDLHKMSRRPRLIVTCPLHPPPQFRLGRVSLRDGEIARGMIEPPQEKHE